MWSLAAIPLLLIALSVAHDASERRATLHRMRGFYQRRVARVSDAIDWGRPPMRPEDVLT